MAPVITFAAALAALVVFLAFKITHMRYRWQWYDRLRGRADRRILLWGHSLEERVTRIESQLSPDGAFQFVVGRLGVAIAHGARYVEHRALTMSRTFTHATQRKEPTPSSRSSFLREVSSHKNGLDTERIKRESKIDKSV